MDCASFAKRLGARTLRVAAGDPRSRESKRRTNCRCCSKGSTGGASSALTNRSSRYKKALFYSVLCCVRFAARDISRMRKAADLPKRRRSPKGRARSRPSPRHRAKNRAREAALRDRMLEAHEVRPLLRAARYPDRPDAAHPGGPRGDAGRDARGATAGFEGRLR